MTLETLSSIKEILEGKKSEIEKNIQIQRTFMAATVTTDLLVIDRGAYFFKENKNYHSPIYFYVKEKEDENMYVSINSKGHIDTSWSSGSCRDADDTELEKAEKYLEKVVAFIKHIRATDFTSLINSAKEFYFENIEPLYSDLFKIEEQLKEINTQIEKILLEGELEEAKKVLCIGMHKFSDRFWYNNKDWTYSILITTNKQGKHIVHMSDSEWGVKKTLTDELYINLYRHYRKYGKEA